MYRCRIQAGATFQTVYNYMYSCTTVVWCESSMLATMLISASANAAAADADWQITTGAQLQER